MFPKVVPESRVVVDIAADDESFADWVSGFGQSVNPETLGCFFRTSESDTRIVLKFQFGDPSYPISFRHEVGHWIDSFSKGGKINGYHSLESAHFEAWRVSIVPMGKRIEKQIDEYKFNIRKASPWLIRPLLAPENVRKILFNIFPKLLSEIISEYERADSIEYLKSDHEAWARFISQVTDKDSKQFYEWALELDQGHIYWSPEELERSLAELPEDLQPIRQNRLPIEPYE